MNPPDLNERERGEQAGLEAARRGERRRPMPYRYRITISIDINGDGLHADGDGATATERRLLAMLKADPRVLGAHVLGAKLADE